MSEQGSNARTLQRRGFHTAVINGLGGLMGMALSVPAAIYLLFPPRGKKGAEWVEAADLSKLETNVPEEIVFRRTRVDGWKISSEKSTAWVIKKSPAEVIAFAPTCTHLGCAFRYEESRKTFLCPCHNSDFSLDGKVIDGPAPRPLDRFEVRIQGTKLLLGPMEKVPEA